MQAILFATSTAPASVPARAPRTISRPPFDQYSNDRHRAGSVLREAIRECRAELRHEGRRCPSAINERISLMNLAVWRRGQPMQARSYPEIFAHAAHGPGRLP